MPSTATAIATTASLPGTPELVRNLRSSLDEVGASVEKCYVLIATLEDALGLERTGGERPTAQTKTSDMAPVALAAFAYVEVLLQQHLGELTKTRRLLNLSVRKVD